MSNKIWTPGQKLNNEAEVMQALLDGQKVTRKIWQGTNSYAHLVDGHLCNAGGMSTHPEYITYHDAVIYAPPEAWQKAEAACRAREVILVAVDPATEVPTGWEIKK